MLLMTAVQQGLGAATKIEMARDERSSMRVG
jgi:hypothetical protein